MTNHVLRDIIRPPVGPFLPQERRLRGGSCDSDLKPIRTRIPRSARRAGKRKVEADEGDAALLRFAAAAEILETDSAVQYNE